MITIVILVGRHNSNSKNIDDNDHDNDDADGNKKATTGILAIILDDFSYSSNNRLSRKRCNTIIPKKHSQSKISSKSSAIRVHVRADDDDYIAWDQSSEVRGPSGLFTGL